MLGHKQNKIQNYRYNDCNESIFESAINNMRAEDIIERKTGKWIKTGGSFRCSECVSMPVFKDIRTLKYCPNCGARMEGE